MSLSRGSLARDPLTFLSDMSIISGAGYQTQRACIWLLLVDVSRLNERQRPGWPYTSCGMLSRPDMAVASSRSSPPQNITKSSARRSHERTEHAETMCETTEVGVHHPQTLILSVPNLVGLRTPLLPQGLSTDINISQGSRRAFEEFSSHPT